MQVFVRVLLPLAALIPFSHTFAVAPKSPGEQVNTTSGLITGHPAPDYPSVSEYLGIPFAEPPIAELRFAPPTPYISKGPIKADKQPLSCPQSPGSYNYSLPQPAQELLGNKGSFANHTSEDCLYLNVWTKRANDSAAKKAILIWFYGGGFHSGGASDNTEQGALFAGEQDVVIISFNYRLGIFGFPGVGVSQNLALLDQRLLVEWVRDNAAAFGGDPTRIALFGHSAGGASIDYYSYAWKDDPIVAGTVPMSGTATSFGHRTAETGLEAWGLTAELLGCGNSDSTSTSVVISCMRQKTTEQVFNASLEAGNNLTATLPTLAQFYVSTTGIWSPTTDNVTVFANYSTLGQEGMFIQRPILTGSNSDEACLFTERGQLPLADDPLTTETVFTCPINWAAIYRASANLPTWKYLWLGTFNSCFRKASC